MISLAHRTVFVHVPKCGGQSVELAFLNDLGLSWKTRKALLLAARPKGWGGEHPRLAHLKAREYLGFDYLSREMWSKYFSFAIVRNPFARVASAYHYLDPRIDSLEEFAVSLVQSRRKGFMDPAWDYFRDENGEQLVSAWYRLEEIAECWPAIAARSHLRDAPLPYRNAMGHKKPGAVWTEAAIQAVRDVYADDFSRFGYADDAPPERHRPADAASE